MAYRIRAAPRTVSAAPRITALVIGEEVAATPSAGGAAAAPLVEGVAEVPEADPLAEPLAEPVADPDGVDVADREDALLEESDDAVLLLAELDAAEDAPAVEDDETMPVSPVEIRLGVVLAGTTSELEGEGSLTKSTMILISVHWSPIDSS